MHHLTAPLSFLMTTLILVGCSENSGPTVVARGHSISPFSREVNPYSRPSELALDALGRDVPGFGGMYSDSTGSLYIFLLDSLDAPNARATVASFVQNAEGVVKPIRIRQGQYSLLQLRAWQPSVDLMLAVPGVLSTDLDEASNRLRVTVMDASAHNSVKNKLHQSGIPLDAVLVELGSPSQLTATLSSLHRPLRGGNLVYSGSGDSCSMSFNAIDNWDRVVFAIASHCSGGNVGDGVNGTAFYQPTFFTYNLVGSEVYDPLIFSCLGGTRMCRWSDAALIELDISSNSDPGRIHKTLFRDRDQGSTTIDSSDPYFAIIEETPYPSSSEIGDLVLNKMGYNTGWTNGRLAYTCVNKNVFVGGQDTGITLLCQDAVAANAQGGDSGSPVFRKVGNNSADLYGILWGNELSFQYQNFIFWFSSMWNIESELLPLQTF